MRRWLLALTAICACDTVPIHLTGIQDRDVVTEAIEAHLNLGIEFVPYQYGAVTLDLRDEGITRDDGTPVEGRAYDGRVCRRQAWSTRKPKVIAHEVGHTLGLDHADDEHNLMARAAAASDGLVTDDQHATLRREVGVLRFCR